VIITPLEQLPIGWRISRLRRSHGWSQQYLADQLGKSKSWVDKVERGVRRLDRLSILHEAAQTLGVPLDVLLSETKFNPPQSVQWIHVECGHTTRVDPASPPDNCRHCGGWEGNWHQAVTPSPPH
jgi:transcriptional regulator with XRE-family HTH domain